MQPYLFPYIGYFQLIAAADRFVFLDDAAFIKQGWIHRNRILVSSAPHTFSVPLKDASSFRPICETAVHHGEFRPKKLLRTIEMSYSKAPHFSRGLAIANEVFTHPHSTIADMARHSVKAVSALLGLTPGFVDTSRIYQNENLSGQDRVVDIAKRENATRYVNAIGGTDLYDERTFATAGIELRFLKSREITYPQFGAPFVPWLSILDVLMFNPLETIRAFLREFDLVRADAAA